MSEPLSADYRRLLEPWCRFARRHLQQPAPGQLCFGIGGHGHWSMQAHETAFAAFAVLAADPATDPRRTGYSRDELTAAALALLRFMLASHRDGGGTCADGQTWGHSWISVLGPERAMHGIEALEPVLPASLRDLRERVLASEAGWLLEHYPVKAGLTLDNKPESNLWNGAFLHRTARLFPAHPSAAAWREKGTAFLLNAISVPADAQDAALIDGRPVRDWHAGPNFSPAYGLNHHHYLNVGYMVICLSNLALLHFACRSQKWDAPEALERHARELWRLVRACTFPDGRLLRIGGDTRVRYAYCQDYAIPMWLWAADRAGDALAASHEAGWLAQVTRERSRNRDGSFMGERLDVLRARSPNYYLRLEGDKAASLSMGAYWRRILPDFPAAPPAPAEPVLAAWEDPFHGAFFHRGPRRFASWVWNAAELPQGLCQPPEASDWAEWRHNLAGCIKGVGLVNTPAIKRHTGRSFAGGFITAGRVGVTTQAFISEGDLDEEVARVDLAFAALPDGATTVVLQRARTPHLVYLSEWKSLLWQVVNDIQNGLTRRFFWEGKSRTFRGPPGKAQRLELRSRWINVEDRMGAVILYGADSFRLNRPADRQIAIRDTAGRPQSSAGGGSVYAEEILLHHNEGIQPVQAGTPLFDLGCALRCGESHAETAERARKRIKVIKSGDIRAVQLKGADGIAYTFTAHFGDEPQPFNGGTLAPGECTLTPLP